MDFFILPQDMINEIISYLDFFSLIDLCNTCKYLNLLSINKMNEFKNQWENSFKIIEMVTNSMNLNFFVVQFKNRNIGEIYPSKCYLKLDDTLWHLNKSRQISNWLKNKIKKITTIDSKLVEFEQMYLSDFILNRLRMNSLKFEINIIVLKYLYYFSTNYKIED